MNPHALKRAFPRASASTLAANAGEYGSGAPSPAPTMPASEPEAAKQAQTAEKHYDDNLDHPRTNPKLECDPSNAPLATSEVQEGAESRICVRVCSVRKRLLDEDNLCEKYAVDSLRAIAAIPADDPATVRIETTQRKAAKGEAEHTEITITYPELS